MPAPDPVIAVVREWLVKADNDLLTATHTLTLGVDCPTDTVCLRPRSPKLSEITNPLVTLATWQCRPSQNGKSQEYQALSRQTDIAIFKIELARWHSSGPLVVAGCWTGAKLVELQQGEGKHTNLAFLAVSSQNIRCKGCLRVLRCN
jgi:hypothetical protein